MLGKKVLTQVQMPACGSAMTIQCLVLISMPPKMLSIQYLLEFSYELIGF
jgi:hypothetical protein